VLLQSAIRRLDQQRYPEALTKLEEANTAFPGWWLVREHMAEVLALQGNDAAAITIYDEVIAQTGLPQYMDAQAECYMRAGRSAEATALFAKADALWKEQLRLFPESASGHALEHFMALNHDPAFVVKLAQENFSNRPGGDARVLLAKAYLSVGRPKDALTQVHALLASPYRTVEGLEVALDTFRTVGDEKNAEKISAEVASEKNA
jgi:tetratricopeptide (TPR) repeat protein